MATDRVTGIFVDEIGTAAATSGVLSPLGGRIFGLLYLHDRPLALDEIATALEQSKNRWRMPRRRWTRTTSDAPHRGQRGIAQRLLPHRRTAGVNAATRCSLAL